MKFRQKKKIYIYIGNFGFGQCVRKLPKNKGKMLFDETNFEMSNINRKPLIWSKYKIITKFGQFTTNYMKTARKLGKSVI